MGIYVLVVVFWDKIVDRICWLMDCREDFVKFLEKNIYFLFVIIYYFLFKNIFKELERVNDLLINFFGCKVNFYICLKFVLWN